MSSRWPAAIALLLASVAGCSTAAHQTTAAPKQPAVAGQATSRVPTGTVSVSVVAPASPVPVAPGSVSPSAAPPPSGTQAPAALSNGCATARLALLAGSVDHAAGSSYATFYLRNTGTADCVLYGFPGVSMLDAQGRIIQRPADWNGAARTPVTLQPGGRARFVLQSSDPSIPGTGCSPGWKSVRIQVYPPNQTRPLSQPSTFQACDLSVGPVQPAS